MALTIEQIEEQISSLQKKLEELKNPKLEVIRQFTGQYFSPYQEKKGLIGGNTIQFLSDIMPEESVHKRL